MIDGEGQVAARAGEEVYMAGGYVGVSDEWVLQQIPAACRGEYFVVGNEVRPNLRHDSDLFALDVISTTERTVLFLRYKPTLDAAGGERRRRSTASWSSMTTTAACTCRPIGDPVQVTLLWPPDWSVRASDGEVMVVDGSGRLWPGRETRSTCAGGQIPQDMDFAAYRATGRRAAR